MQAPDAYVSKATTTNNHQSGCETDKQTTRKETKEPDFYVLKAIRMKSGEEGEGDADKKGKEVKE